MAAHRLHASFAVRASQQQPATGQHGRGDDGVIPGDGDHVTATEVGEVRSNTTFDFVRGEKCAVAVLLPLRPATVLVQHALQHVRGGVAVPVAVGEGGDRQPARQGRTRVNEARRYRALQKSVNLPQMCTRTV